MSMGRTAASLLWPGFGAFVCWLSPVSPARAVASEAVPWRRESPVWRQPHWSVAASAGRLFRELLSPKLKHDLRYLYERQGATVAQCNPDAGFFLGNLGCLAFTNLNFNPRGVKGDGDGFLALAVQMF